MSTMAENAENTEKEKFETWAHVKFAEKHREVAEELDTMVLADGSDRSKFIRNLIHQEWLRRNRQAHWILASADPSQPLDLEVKNPVVAVPS